MMAKLPSTKAFDTDLVSELESRYCRGSDPDDRAIFWPGVVRWYALRVPPQREDQAEAWLKRRGVYAFHPVLRRNVVRYGVTHEQARRYLPGYVFARFPGQPREHMVVASPFILGALCRSDGFWGILRPQGLRAIYAMRKIDQAEEASRAERKRAGLLRVGDQALFMAGPFADFPCEVIEVMAGGGAKVRLQLFGREVPFEAKDGTLVPLFRK